MVNRHIELKVTSDAANLAAVRKAVETFAATTGLSESAVNDLGLCVNETLANIIRHAYEGRTDGPIELRVEAHDDRVLIFIRDWGSGVDPSSVPQEPYDPLKPGGVGLMCIRQLMDEISYTPQPDGMLTVMSKRRT
ncbi:MAG TPA: ATP-binding protein [Tepidisphaeraceae bacterium]